MYKVNKEKCIGCGVCVAASDGGTTIKDDGKAEVIDSEKVEKSGGESICPYEAVEKEENNK